MFPSERREKILEILEREEFIKLKQLQQTLDISMETLRRDIQQLDESARITKEYGGIRIKKEHNGESIINKRLNSNIELKENIAQKALEEINDGDCIFLDSGSTTLQIAKHLDKRSRLTIITNSIPVMLQAINYGHTIISIGGKVRASEQSITSYDFLFNFDKLNIDKAFICCSGLSVEKGATDYNLEEVETRRKILEISNRKYLTTDHSKYNKVVTVKICDLEELDILITDNKMDASSIEQIKTKNIKVL